MSDYRGRSNLVFILAGGMNDENLLRLLDQVAGRSSEFTGEEAQVIVILLTDKGRKIPSEGREGRPFVFLADREGIAHRLFNVFDAGGATIPAIFVADRYGETYVQYRPEEWQGQGMTDELLQWLLFINSQCPECGVADWPQ